MRRFGLAGLFLCLGMVGGVRGQEVMQQNSLTGFTDIVIGENEVCEILNLSGNAFVKSIGYSVSQEILDTPDEWVQQGDSGINGWIWYTNPRYTAFRNYFNSSPTIFLSSLGVQKPVIFGPCKIILSSPWNNYQNPDSGLFPNAQDFLGAETFSNYLITYRVLQKQGYSSAITPTSLASNTNFVSSLTQTILSSSNNYGLASRAELIQALAESRADGVNSVLNNPNQWTLYTTNQIHTMAIGDLVLTSTNNGQFVLNYDIEQSEDLVNWYPYQGFAMPLTNLPTNKAFVRIKAKQ